MAPDSGRGVGMDGCRGAGCPSGRVAGGAANSEGVTGSGLGVVGTVLAGGTGVAGGAATGADGAVTVTGAVATGAGDVVTRGVDGVGCCGASVATRGAATGGREALLGLGVLLCPLDSRTGATTGAGAGGTSTCTGRGVSGLCAGSANKGGTFAAWGIAEAEVWAAGDCVALLSFDSVAAGALAADVKGFAVSRSASSSSMSRVVFGAAAC